ncbi:HD domain-containing protein [Phycicoccus sp. Soil748]|uniref:HD domain-containing protein n=1 Tax=Phycicoccus sp. Soil748 TaxID=1736397 RepID=UPI0007031D12|nr:HD domain-containing protein [Phycicoccus sp. Soil748]KRE56422.1 hypothetical protein ASG70_04710 [Phycicoccus sp. Soil748]
MTDLLAECIAERLLRPFETRWHHVCGVAAAAEVIAAGERDSKTLIDAAWLHDIGYSPDLNRTGFHPLDGARFLSDHDCTEQVVGLVAFHTGAEFEAEERGLTQELQAFPRPDQSLLDSLILADLSVSPLGLRVHPEERIEEILDRYPPSDPVHRAVIRSRTYLLACAARAAVRTGSPDEWGFSAA